MFSIRKHWAAIFSCACLGLCYATIPISIAANANDKFPAIKQALSASLSGSAGSDGSIDLATALTTVTNLFEGLRHGNDNATQEMLGFQKSHGGSAGIKTQGPRPVLLGHEDVAEATGLWRQLSDDYGNALQTAEKLQQFLQKLDSESKAAAMAEAAEAAQNAESAKSDDSAKTVQTSEVAAATASPVPKHPHARPPPLPEMDDTTIFGNGNGM